MMLTSRLWHYALFLFFGISPIFYVPIIGPVHPEEAVGMGYLYQELFVRYGMLFLILFGMLKQKKREFTPHLFVILGLTLLITNAVTGLDVNARRALLNVLIAIVFLKTVIEHFEFQYLKTLGWVALAVLAVNGLWMVFQYFGVDGLFQRPDARSDVHLFEKMIGFTKLKVNIGILAALMAPLMAFIHPLLMFLAIPFIFVSQSSAASVAWLVAALIVFYFDFKRSIFWAMAGILAAWVMIYVLKFDMPDGQFTERFQVWAFSFFAVLKTNPVFGMGLGSFATLDYETLQNGGAPIGWIWVHNEYLQWFFETGLIGLTFMVLYLKGFFKDFMEFFRDKITQVLFASAVTVLLISVLHFPFHVGKFAGISLIVLALYKARVEELRCRKC